MCVQNPFSYIPGILDILSVCAVNDKCLR